MHLASANGHGDIVEFLIRKGAFVDSIDAFSSTALHIAACRGQNEVIRVLLDHEANVESVNDVGLTPLGIAMVSGHSDCVKMLLERYVPSTEEGKKIAYTPLHVAILCGNCDVFDTIIKESDGTLISNNSNPTLSTPLHCAAFSGNLDIVLKIMRHGGKKLKKLKDVQGKLPSDCVPRGCDDYVEIRELLEEGQERSHPNDKKYSCDSLPENIFHRLSPADKRTKVKRWMMMDPHDPGLLKTIADFQKAAEIKVLLRKARQMDKMVKIHNAYAHIRSDKDFQEDMQDPEISGTVEILRRDASQYEHYSSQPRIGSVLKKLQSLHGDLKSLGEQSLMLDLALVTDVKAAVSKDKSRGEDLQKKLDSHLCEIENLCQIGVTIKGDEIQTMKMDNDTVEPKPIQWKAMLIRNIVLLALITIIGLVLKHQQVP